MFCGDGTLIECYLGCQGKEDNRPHQFAALRERIDIRMLVGYIDCFWWHLTGWYEKETSLENNCSICK